MTARRMPNETFFAPPCDNGAAATPAAKVIPLPTNPARERITWTNLASIEIRPIRFAERPFWQHAAFHLVVGRKNAGKGTMLADLAARVTRGELGEKRQVIWISNGEDSYSIDVRPRIIAAGGDDPKVTVPTSGQVRLPDDAGVIERKARALGNVGLIVVDPLGGSLTGGKSSNHDGDVRPALAPLNELADKLDCIVIGVRHISNKKLEAGALAGVLGSSDWVNVPRAVIAIAQDDSESDLRHMQVVAGNRVRQAQGRTFRLEGHLLPGHDEEVTRAVWIGNSEKDVADLLAAPPRSSRSGKARDLILEILDERGTVESDALDAEVARRAGISTRTVQNLRNEIRNKGLIKSFSETDGTRIKRWLVTRTNARRRRGASTLSLVGLRRSCGAAPGDPCLMRPNPAISALLGGLREITTARQHMVTLHMTSGSQPDDQLRSDQTSGL
jgi:hypothetical protein